MRVGRLNLKLCNPGVEAATISTGFAYQGLGSKGSRFATSQAPKTPPPPARKTRNLLKSSYIPESSVLTPSQTKHGSFEAPRVPAGPWQAPSVALPTASRRPTLTQRAQSIQLTRPCTLSQVVGFLLFCATLRSRNALIVLGRFRVIKECNVSLKPQPQTPNPKPLALHP